MVNKDACALCAVAGKHWLQNRMVSSLLTGRAKVVCDSEELQALEGSTVNGQVAQGQVELFVSGRLAVFGEHSDWSGAMRRCGLF